MPAPSGIRQKFYHLQGTSEYLLVDFAVLTLAAPDKFLVREIHGEAVFLFNKGNAVQIPPLDAEAFVKDAEDLAANYGEALAWFRETIEAVDEGQVRGEIFES